MGGSGYGSVGISDAATRLIVARSVDGSRVTFADVDDA
jgi:hypothetical protein